MSKFGLDDADDDQSLAAPVDMTTKLASFPLVRARERVDMPAMDAAAAAHGFTSREGGRRRRRRIKTEETRHLAMRVTASTYNRFEEYADYHKLTYAEAVERLLDNAGTIPMKPTR